MCNFIYFNLVSLVHILLFGILFIANTLPWLGISGEDWWKPSLQMQSSQLKHQTSDKPLSCTIGDEPLDSEGERGTNMGLASKAALEQIEATEDP